MHPKAMSSAAEKFPIPLTAGSIAVSHPVSVRTIFLEFLWIGATSFGGGVVAYLRSGLVVNRQWINDEEFVELLAISQTLPGLNATNMAILVGDRMRGIAGAIAAVLGICLPGGLFMFAAGIAYQKHGDRPLVTAMLKGVAAAAVGLILATAIQLGKKSLAQIYDLVFVAATVLAVAVLHQSVPRALLCVGILAILWYRPRRSEKANSTQ
jgi:chromate transporter